MIYSVGHTAIDFLFEVDELPKANASVPIKNYTQQYGGGAANCAVICARLGKPASLISPVGADFPDSDYEKHLRSCGVGLTNIVVFNDDKTARCFLYTDKDGRQMSSFYWGASKRFVDMAVPELMLGKGDIIHITTAHPDFNKRIAERYGNVSFDAGYDLPMYSKADLMFMLRHTKFLFCNEHEIKAMLQKLGERKLANLFKHGVAYIIVTKGSKGSEVHTPEGRIAVPAVKVKRVVDPTGAGDAYHMAFLSAYLDGESPKGCAAFASKVASQVIQHKGAQLAELKL